MDTEILYTVLMMLGFIMFFIALFYVLHKIYNYRNLGYVKIELV